jgi:hypothetical protein
MLSNLGIHFCVEVRQGRVHCVGLTDLVGCAVQALGCLVSQVMLHFDGWGGQEMLTSRGVFTDTLLGALSKRKDVSKLTGVSNNAGAGDSGLGMSPPGR